MSKLVAIGKSPVGTTEVEWAELDDDEVMEVEYDREKGFRLVKKEGE